MASYHTHNIRFYNPKPEPIKCMSHEPGTKKLTLARLVNIYYILLDNCVISSLLLLYYTYSALYSF